MSDKPTLEFRYARRASATPLSSYAIAKLPDIYESFRSLGLSPFKDDKTVRRCVMTFADTVKRMYISDIAAKKNKSDKFQLTFDEWNLTRGRRYMNVNLHSSSGFSCVENSPFVNLALVRVYGSMPAEKCVELL